MKWNNKFIYPKSTRSIVNGSRHYSIDNSNLPSVTSILSATKSEEDKAALAAWKERVGHKEAERIKNEASSRGTSMHNYLESFLQNKFNLELIEEDNKAKKMAEEIIDNGLKKNLSEVWGAEATLYYPGKYAGTTDMIGVYKGRPAIIDFKQTNRPKKREWIQDYLMQLSAYAQAHNKLFNTDIDQGVILMCSRDLTFQRFELQGENFTRAYDTFMKKLDFYSQSII